MARERAKVRVVMLAPKTISSGRRALRKSATAARVSSEQEVGGPAGCEDAAVIGIRLEQVVGDAVQAVAGDLGAARVIQEDVGELEGGELRANGGDIHGHDLLLGFRNASANFTKTKTLNCKPMGERSLAIN